MAETTNAFFGLDSATLLTLRTNYVTAITEVATIGQSFSIPGRSVNTANLSELKATLNDINAAISNANGTRKRGAVFRFGGM